MAQTIAQAAPDLWRTMDGSLEASAVDYPGASSATPHPPALQSVPQLPPALPSPMGAPPQPLPFAYPLAPNPIGGMAPPHTPYSQSVPFFTIVREHESLPPPVGPIGSQFPYGMPPFAGGVPPTLQSPMTPGALRPYSFPPMLSDPGGPSGIPRGPAPSFARPYNQSAMPTSELGLGQPANGREEELSPNAIRKLSHNAVEVRRRRRISTQLDRLRTMLNSPKSDKASLLSDAVKRLTLLTKRCNSLESELAMYRGTGLPPPSVRTPIPAPGSSPHRHPSPLQPRVSLSSPYPCSCPCPTSPDKPAVWRQWSHPPACCPLLTSHHPLRA